MLKEPLMQNFVFFFLVKGEWYIKKFWLVNLYSILDHGNICGIEISQCFYLVIASQEFNAIANNQEKSIHNSIYAWQGHAPCICDLVVFPYLLLGKGYKRLVQEFILQWL